MKKITINYQGPNFQITVEAETAYDASYDLRLILESSPFTPEKPQGPVDGDFKEVEET